MHFNKTITYIIYLNFSILSGILLTLSFPNWNISWLAWISLIPVLYAAGHSSIFFAFMCGGVTGLFHYFSLMYWIASTLTQLVHFSFITSCFIHVCLSMYLSLYIAIFVCLSRIKITSLLLRLMFVPCVWVCFEYLRTYFFSGFPWGIIGYSQYQTIHMIQIADICGVYGVSFLIILFNWTLFLSFKLYWENKHHTIKNPFKKPIQAILIGCFILISVYSYGVFRIQTFDDRLKTYPTARFAIIQGNINQSIKWNNRLKETITRKYLTLSLNEQNNQPDLIIWPETALTYYFQEDNQYSVMVKSIIRSMRIYFLIGSPYYDYANSGTVRCFNTAFLINQNGQIENTYHKVHLVPWGEYVPLSNWLPIQKITEGEIDFSSGQIQSIPFRDNHIAIQICYEIIFPDITRSIVKQHANILINQTNDAWFGHTSAAYQHFSMTIFRAIENRRALIRCANTGISGWIDPIGRIQYQSPIFTEDTKTFTVPLIENQSVYTYFGDWFIIICFVFLGIILWRPLQLQIEKLLNRDSLT